MEAAKDLLPKYSPNEILILENMKKIIESNFALQEEVKTLKRDFLKILKHSNNQSEALRELINFAVESEQEFLVLQENLGYSIKNNKLLEILGKITHLVLALNEEIGEFKGNTLLNISHTQHSKKDIQDFKCSLTEQKEDIQKLKNCIEVLSSHIVVLEKRNKKFTDCFKFGRFKFKKLEEEEVFKNNLKSLEAKRFSFSFNDD